MTYEQALAYIASLEPRGWRLGLDRMRAFCEAAGLADDLGADASRRFVHVAGTNGKGSTTAYLQSLMVESGYRTGAFFSPFVVDPRERVQFGREMIPPDDLAAITQSLIPTAESFESTEYGGITEFEFKTAVRFAYWKQTNCQWVAVEVGLGGRFDATNVITPAASIIVSIGLDHMQILGDTIGKIAFEKAGIVKPGIPVIIGDLPQEATEVVEQVAKDCGAAIWKWGREVAWFDGHLVTPAGQMNDVWPGIRGEKQGHNMALAIAALQAAGCVVSEDGIRRGTLAAFVPGRFQTLKAMGTTFLLDGAHNPDSARVLRNSMQDYTGGRNVVLLTNMVRGHEPADFYKEITSLVQSAHVVPVDFHRAFSVKETLSAVGGLLENVRGHESVQAGLESAAQDAGPDGIVLVTGSFYLVGAVLRALQP